MVNVECKAAAAEWSEVVDATADINECTCARPPCSGIADCRNTPGSFECSCPVGYQLAEDRTTCRGQSSDSRFVFVYDFFVKTELSNR